MGRRKFLKRKCEYLLIITVVGLARALPRPVGRRAFRALGGLAGRLLGRDRHRAVENLAIAFPEAPRPVREAMARAMFRTLGANAYDFLTLAGADARRLDALVAGAEGMEHFERAWARGRGVIVVTGHIGCWEIMPAYFVRLGYPVTVIARRMRDRRLDRRLAAARASVGVETLDRDAPARRAVEVLERRRVLGVLVDQHTRVAGAYVPFFGRPAHTPTGAAKLSLLTGAPVVPMADYAGPDGRHTIRVLEPIVPPRRPADRRRAVVELTAEYSRAVERLVRLDPKQWVWFHDRWRDRTGGGAAYAMGA